VGPTEVTQHAVVERLGADAHGRDAGLRQAVEARRRGVVREHLDRPLAGGGEAVQQVGEGVRERRRRAATHVDGRERRVEARAVGGGDGVDLLLQRGEVAGGEVVPRAHLVVRAEGADPRAEGHVDVGAGRGVEHADDGARPA